MTKTDTAAAKYSNTFLKTKRVPPPDIVILGWRKGKLSVVSTDSNDFAADGEEGCFKVFICKPLIRIGVRSTCKIGSESNAAIASEHLVMRTASRAQSTTEHAPMKFCLSIMAATVNLDKTTFWRWVGKSPIKPN